MVNLPTTFSELAAVVTFEGGIYYSGVCPKILLSKISPIELYTIRPASMISNVTVFYDASASTIALAGVQRNTSHSPIDVSSTANTTFYYR
jgi:hypothetical protein